MINKAENTLQLALLALESYEGAKPTKKGRTRSHVDSVIKTLKDELEKFKHAPYRDSWDILDLPKSIRVAAFDITVEEMDSKAATSKARYGEFSSLELKIRIEESGNIKTVDTLIHEINHAIYWAYNIEDGDKEERIVSIMATAWTQVYRDNPYLVRFIANRLGDR